MKARVFIPADSAALSVGADSLAHAFAAEAKKRALDVTIVRTGSRGLLFLDPLVEVEHAGRRIGYANVAAADVVGLFDAHVLSGGAHALCIGPVDDHPLMKRQTRFIFARCGIVDPLSLDDYRAAGGFNGLERAMALGAAASVEEVIASGLRGRGGAGFPTGVKWRTVMGAEAPQKYVVCNADEGDSGTFADRMVMEGDPFLLIEGMMIAGFCAGARQGYVYIRSEYPHAFRTFQAALDKARAQGVLGLAAFGPGKPFDIEARLGAGAYICGEETSLLESLEGKRGQVRAKPPIPAFHGLFGQPTIVNNVLSLAATPWILEHGGKAYGALGHARSRGTQPFTLGGDVKRGGLYELPLGLAIRELVEDIGGGTRSGRPIRAVQVGGPLGAYFPQSLLDTPLDYEAMIAAKGMLGHGGVVVFNDTVDLAKQARFAFAFCAFESCGKCTPCRIGSTRGAETIDKIIRHEKRQENIALVRDLCDTMTDGSLCALGGLTPIPVLSALDNFPEDFSKPPMRLAAE